jgi:hypothetical protein
LNASTKDALERRLVALGLGLSLVGLALHVSVYAFVTDDAFIAFRYARNLAEGLGPVFNPGERVEGYSSPLHVLLLAAGFRAGIDPERAARAISLAATLGLWALVVWFAARSRRAGEARWPVLVAPGGLALTRSVAVWSTGGLETRLFELLVISAVLRLIVELEVTPRRRIAGWLFALAALTRPDGALIGAATLVASGLRVPSR